MLNHKKLWYRLLWFIILIILASPAIYWFTGIGQTAETLSANIGYLPNGTLTSSPKAQALHALSLPMRLERMIIYPLLLLAFQFSGMALALRLWLETFIQSLPAATAPSSWLAKLLNRTGRLVPSNFKKRLSGQDVVIILLFILLLNLGIFILYLPFNFYRSFILAHQFGLSTQSMGGWLGDWAKSVFIALVLDGLLWGGLYVLMRLLPRRWPIIGGGLLMLSGFVLALAAPLIITPLFFQVKPLNDTELESRILTLAQRAGMPVDGVYTIDASTKTTTVNAYVTSFGDAQRIVLYDTLLAGYTPDEVEVVLAHELGHWYYRHVFWSVLGMGALGWVGLFALHWLLNRIWQRLELRGPADVAGLPFVLAVITVATMLSLPFQNGISRYGEHQADKFALIVSQKPEVFTDFFIQLAEQNLTIVDPPTWEKLIFYTHPPTVERIQLAKEYLRQ